MDDQGERVVEEFLNSVKVLQAINSSKYGSSNQPKDKISHKNI